jgi:hypothetical protein
MWYVLNLLHYRACGRQANLIRAWRWDNPAFSYSPSVQKEQAQLLQFQQTGRYEIIKYIAISVLVWNRYAIIWKRSEAPERNKTNSQN